MKTILVFDTETNNLPLWSLPSEHPDQPRVTQLAAELCDEETGDVLGACNFLIRPENWTIPEDLQQMTGITMQKVEEFGVPINIALQAFIELWMSADVRVAHNESFDMRMIRIELMRHAVYSQETLLGDAGHISFADYWKQAPAFCTQGKSVSIINLPPTEKMIAAKRKGPKSPNLSEAYKFFTGKELFGAHNAQVDIMACKAVYFGIKNHAKVEAV